MEAARSGRTAEKDSGDAVRIYGREAAPGLKIELPKTKGRVGTCHPVNVFVQDAAGRSVPEATVDLVLKGKGVTDLRGDRSTRGTSAPATSGFRRSSTARSRWTSISTEPGRTIITAWLDEDSDGRRDATERDATARFRWRRSIPRG